MREELYKQILELTNECEKRDNITYDISICIDNIPMCLFDIEKVKYSSGVLRFYINNRIVFGFCVAVIKDSFKWSFLQLENN